MIRSVLCILAASLFAATSVAQEAKEPAKTNTRPVPAPVSSPEPFDGASVEKMSSHCVLLETEAGAIMLEMYPEQAPETVRNFLNLAATGFFDTTTFNRVVPNFVIQGGNAWTCEDGKVTAVMGARALRTIPDEPNKILHDPGVVSMARGDEANTATINFFILVAAAPYLDGKFAAFGRVTKGMDVVEAINKAPVMDEKPDKPVRVKKASVYQCS